MRSWASIPYKRILRMIIFDIPRDMTEKEILACIMKQNQDRLKKNAAEMKFCFRTGRKHNEETNWNTCKVQGIYSDQSLLQMSRIRTHDKVLPRELRNLCAFAQHEEILLRAYDAAIPKKKWHNRCVPWWMQEVTRENRDTYRARKKYQGSKGPATREQ
ncbi:uncharacterized protein LOC122576265 [Bombus pyrosoma]|uniref:uncharacterized protein LOC122576265 n=1 Tax=Bombus pyrosoma TaxID=396416 RepID=UPI001CB9815C|nr:uncharacterized protein LOC122576265 [Bombus pyrosoma]